MNLSSSNNYITYIVNFKFVLLFQFQAPIASAWILDEGKFQNIDLFSGTIKDENNGYITPSLYIGMHKKQVFI